MWEPLIELMHSPLPGVQRHAIWISGTAVQNNSTAQKEVRLLPLSHDLTNVVRQFLKRDPLPYLLSLLTSGGSGGTRSKVLYCLSGTLKHSASAVQRLHELGGWEVLKSALQGTCIHANPHLVLMTFQTRISRCGARQHS